MSIIDNLITDRGQENARGVACRVAAYRDR